MTPVIYRCLACLAEQTLAVSAPPQWDWQRRQVPRQLCSACGGACAPEGWRLAAFEAAEQHAAQGVRLEALAFGQWARCPNALACHQEGMYAGDCEQAQAVMPKCLAALHARLERTERCLQRLAGNSPGHPPEPQAGLEPPSASQPR